MKTCPIIAAALLGLSAPPAEAAAAAQTFTIKAHGLSVVADGIDKKNFADVKSVVQQQIALTDDQTVTPPLADDMAFFVRQRYLDLGYPEVGVEWEISGDAAILHVKEGQSYKVGHITFEGYPTGKRKELKGYLLRPTHEKLDTSGSHPPFVESDLRSGAELVHRYVQGQGYLDAEGGAPVFTPHPATGFQDVLLKIKEGRRYTFGAFQVTGELEDHAADVRKLFKGLPGQPYSEVKVASVGKSIMGIYQQYGHYSVAAVATADPASHREGIVPVLYQVTLGPRYVITAVRVSSSLSRGAQRIIHSGIDSAVGHHYSPSYLETVEKRMLQTDVFSRLEFHPEPQPDGDMVMEVTGKESPQHRISLYGGYQTFVGPILGVDFRNVNFHDTGDALRLMAEYSGVGPRGDVGWINPAFFDSGFSLDTELTASTYSPYDYYERRSLGLRSTLARQWTKHFSSSVFGEVSTNDTTSTLLDAADLGPARYSLARAGGAITFDYRDSPVQPTKGWYGSAGITGTVGGDVSYLRTDLAFSYYLPLTDKFRVALGARSSAIQNSGGADALPIDLRLFNGGATTVRSFAELAMGPRSPDGVPLGGTLSQVANLEFTYAIMSNVDLATFLDAGDLNGVKDDPLSAPSDLRYGIGVGIRYKLPIGPLRLDYGYNPDRHPGEAVGAFHITFGVAF